jgi:hypothetical protein
MSPDGKFLARRPENAIGRSNRRLDADRSSRLDRSTEREMAQTTQPGLDNIAREQFRMFDGIGDRIALTDDDRRRVLLLSDKEWSDWSRVPQGGELPRHPEVAVILLRLGTAAHRLAVMEERRGAGSLLEMASADVSEGPFAAARACYQPAQGEMAIGGEQENWDGNADCDRCDHQHDGYA